jgi:excisionase family DNA binding protein
LSEEYVSVDEAAVELGISRSTVWKWLRRHEIPTFRVLGDRRTLMRRSDVAKLREPIPIAMAKKELAAAS